MYNIHKFTHNRSVEETLYRWLDANPASTYLSAIYAAAKGGCTVDDNKKNNKNAQENTKKSDRTEFSDDLNADMKNNNNKSTNKTN